MKRIGGIEKGPKYEHTNEINKISPIPKDSFLIILSVTNFMIIRPTPEIKKPKSNKDQLLIR